MHGSPPLTYSLPPEAGGEGVGLVAGFIIVGLKSAPLFPSPPMGERVRVRGK